MGKAIQTKVEYAEANKRMEEIRQAVKRINFSWEKGFMMPDEYIEKRTQLQREIEALRPVAFDDLMEAGDLLANFTHYWEKCAEVDNPDDARKQLLAKIVDKVFVYDQQVIAIALHGNFGVILDEDLSVPSEVLEQVAEEIKSGNITTSVSTRFGSDGVQSRSCTKLIIFRLTSRFGTNTLEKRSSFIVLIPSASLLKFIATQKQ